MSSIVVSDLHADYWDDAKLKLFLDFLNNDLVQKAERFILNGDIFDLPSTAINPSWPQRQDGLMTALSELAARIPFVYLTGNHDFATHPLGPMAIRDGSIQLEPEQYRFEDGGASFLLKHGHQYDPLFVSGFYNVDNLIKELTGIDPGIEIEKIFKDLKHRRLPSPADRIKAYRAIAVKMKEDDRGPIVGIPLIFDKIWIIAADHLAREEKVNNVIFGHTHNPETKAICNGQASYINSGDWLRHTTYLLIEDGTAAVKEWPM